MDKQGKTLIAILVVIVLAIVGYQMMATPSEQTPGQQLDAAIENTQQNAEQAAQKVEDATQQASEDLNRSADEAGAKLQQAGEQMSEEAQKLGNKVEDAVTTSPAEEAAKQAE